MATMEATRPTIGIVIGTTRPGRFGEKAAHWLLAQAQRREDLQFTLIDLRDYPMPFFEEKRPPSAKEPDHEAARSWGRTIDALDGFVFVTAEYNRGPSAVLKNAMDYAYHQWRRKPAAFLGYGGLGGARAVEQLRMVCVELQMAVIRNAVHIAGSDFKRAASGEVPLATLEGLPESAGRMFDELSWWTDVLRSARGRRAEAAQGANEGV
jgi:NAD(P)H-dependent FMN reductase